MRVCLKSFVRSTLTAVIMVVGTLQAVAADERHTGYYYPAPQTAEVYQSIAPVLPNASRFLRVGLLVGLNNKQLTRGYAPSYHIFAKGTQAEKLILVSIDSSRYQTLFQLRALLASLTSDARSTDLFKNTGSVEYLNFFDLLKMAGFKQVTISNGRDLAHKVTVK